MRIQSIYVSNFLGAAAVDVKLSAPVALFCGPNAAGKSSVRDAVALALTGDLGRVSLKKDAPALIRDGAEEAAVCQVQDADGDAWSVSITRSGKMTDSAKGKDRDPVLPFVLDAQRFARLPETERRGFLFGLMGIKLDSGEVARRLEKRGGHIGKTHRILPLLRSGFDTASKQAKTYATEAKGAWRQITGETYGSEKAKEWKATVPPYDAAAAVKLATELQHADVALGQWQESIGKLQGEEQRRAQLRAKLPALAEHAGRVQRLQDKLDADEKQLAEWEADLQHTAAAAGATPRTGLVHELARALYAMVLQTHPATMDLGAINELLSRYEKEHGPLDGKAGDSRARQRLPSVQKSRDLMAAAVANAKRDVQTALDAKAEHERITAELAETFDAAGLAEAREQVEKLQAARAALVKRSDEFRTIKALVDGAEAKAKWAGELAADIADWELIGDALAPDGIPAELLAEALGPINSRLAQSATDAQWPKVEISRDMAITANGRAYGLLSESERWRCDAMLAEAIAHVSGTGLLVLDRMDVLDLQGRSDLLEWLGVLADTGEIATALVFATLKAVPQSLPQGITAHWLEAGRLVSRVEEAEAA